MSKLTLSFKGKVLKIYPVPQGSLTIGSDPTSNVVIDSLAVAPHHARIDTKGKDSILVNLDQKEGTFTHQDKISKQQLKDGDLIHIGKHNLSFSFDEVSSLVSDDSTSSIDIDISGASEQLQESAAKAAAPKTAGGPNKIGWLQILSGQNLGKTLSLNRNLTNLGKPGLATAVITRRTDGYFIAQLEGKAPLLIGNAELGERTHQLKDGDVITFGNVRMQFYLE